MSERVEIRRLQTGVPGLDEVLGGGIPEYSFNLLAGGPGCGKTTLAHQIMFANATAERPALYVSVLGEPPLKLLRYQQQFPFFEMSKIGSAVRFLHLGLQALSGGLPLVLRRIVQEVEAYNPSLVIVDSFRAVLLPRPALPSEDSDLQSFVQTLALQLTSYEATTFLLGEYLENEGDSSSVFTVADGIIWLSQAVERSSIVRKLQVIKMRGQEQLPGLHAARISHAGLRVFPRLSPPALEWRLPPPSAARLSSGLPALDEMLGGGVPAGYNVLLAGPSGSGKSILAGHFLIAGGEQGEVGLVATFEQRPDDYLRSSPLRRELTALADDKKLEILWLRPLDLSMEELQLRLALALVRSGARRLVIDSLSGLELALAPSYRADFRDSLERMLGSLRELGVTVLATVELSDSGARSSPSMEELGFLVDAVVVQRNLEVDGQRQRQISVTKVRASTHSSELREYEIAASGLAILPPRPIAPPR